MSNIKDVLLEVFRLTWKAVLQLGIILTLFGWIPHKNILTLILTVLATSYCFKLFSEKPQAKDWLLITPLKTSLTLLAFYLAWSWLGAFGIIGGVLLMILVAAWQIMQQWKLYDAVTMWGALKVKGREPRDFFTFYKEETKEQEKGDDVEQGRTIETIRQGDNSGEEASNHTEPEFDVQGVQVLQQQSVSQVQEHSSEPSLARPADGPRLVVSDVQSPIRKRIRKLKKVI